MQVAVHAHQQAALDLCTEGADRGKQVLALLLQVVDQGLTVTVELGAMGVEQVQGAGQLGADVLGPGLAVVRGAGPRLERRILSGCSQYQVHFAQPLPQHAGKLGQVLEGIGMGLLRRVSGFEFVADSPFQIVLGPVPGVALVAQIALGNHQQVRLVLAVHAAYPTQ
ncbi:hypothetical protein D3C77_514110 [compost metagenome]